MNPGVNGRRPWAPVDEVPCQLPSSRAQQAIRVERVMSGDPLTTPPESVVVIASREAVTEAADHISPPGSAIVLPFIATADRPIRPSPGGQYNMTFFDGRAEYERITVLSTAMLPPAPPPPPPLGSIASPTMDRRQRQLFLQQVSDDAVSDETFAREFPYERLLALDASTPPSRRRKGLSAYHLSLVLRPRIDAPVPVYSGTASACDSGVSDGSQPSSSIDSSDALHRQHPGEECTICLEMLTHNDTESTHDNESSLSTSMLLPSSSPPGGVAGGGVGSPLSTDPDSPPHSITDTATNSGGSMTKLRCRHSFHKRCIANWLSDHTTCPVCRQDVLVMEEESQVKRAIEESSLGPMSNSNSAV